MKNGHHARHRHVFFGTVLVTLLAACGGGGGNGSGPAFISHSDGEVLQSSATELQWVAGDVAVVEWRVRIGSAPGESDLVASPLPLNADRFQFCRLPTDGRRLYVELDYRTSGGDWQTASLELVASSRQPPLTFTASLLDVAPLRDLTLRANRCLDDKAVTVLFTYPGGETVTVAATKGANPTAVATIAPIGTWQAAGPGVTTPIRTRLRVREGSGTRTSSEVTLNVRPLARSPLPAGEVTFAYLKALRERTQAVDGRLLLIDELTSGVGGNAFRRQAAELLTLLDEFEAQIRQVQSGGRPLIVGPGVELSAASLALIDELLLATLAGSPERSLPARRVVQDQLDDFVADFRGMLRSYTDDVRSGLSRTSNIAAITLGTVAVGAAIAGVATTPVVVTGALAGLVITSVGTAVPMVIDGFQASVFDGRASYEDLRPSLQFFAEQTLQNVSGAVLTGNEIFDGALDDAVDGLVTIGIGVAGEAGVFNEVVEAAFEQGELVAEGIVDGAFTIDLNNQFGNGGFDFHVDARNAGPGALEYFVTGPEDYRSEGALNPNFVGVVDLRPPPCAGTYQVGVMRAGAAPVAATSRAVHDQGERPCNENEPPVAIIVPDVIPLVDPVGEYYLPNTEVQYDGSASFDPEDAPDELLFRWAGRLIREDGSVAELPPGSFADNFFDYSVRHSTEGRFVIQLTVRDTGGLMSSTRFVVDIREFDDGLHTETESSFVSWKIGEESFTVVDPQDVDISILRAGGVSYGDLLLRRIWARTAAGRWVSVTLPREGVGPGVVALNDRADTIDDIVLDGASAAANFFSSALDFEAIARSDFNVSRGGATGVLVLDDYDVTDPLEVVEDNFFGQRTVETRNVKLRGTFEFDGATFPPGADFDAINESRPVSGSFLHVGPCRVEYGPGAINPSTCPGYQ